MSHPDDVIRPFAHVTFSPIESGSVGTPSRNLIILNADLPYCLSMVSLGIPAVTIPIGIQPVYPEALWYTFRHPDDFPRLFRPEEIYVPRSMQLGYTGYRILSTCLHGHCNCDFRCFDPLLFHIRKCNPFPIFLAVQEKAGQSSLTTVCVGAPMHTLGSNQVVLLGLQVPNSVEGEPKFISLC